MDTQLTKKRHPGGTEGWWAGTQRHRVDGPALVFPDGTQYLYLHGVRHCTVGPAVRWACGLTAWWVDVHQLGEDTVLDALYEAGRNDELRLIREAWTLGGPNIDDLASAIEQTPV